MSVVLDPGVAPALARAVGGEVRGGADGDGTVVLDVEPARWVAAATWLRDVAGLDFLDWLSAVDQSDADPAGLDVVLHVVDSLSGAQPRADGSTRLRRALLRTRVPDPDQGAASLPSLTAVWPGVAWHERETFEMFGCEFTGFDDGGGSGLRPLLLPEGFAGTPLRKSFVLAARASKPWPGAKEPGESDTGRAPGRRKTLPPGVPDPATWAREPAEEDVP